MKKKAPIKSAEQAQQESNGLSSVWSQESYLTQRTLIYCAHLLEVLAGKHKSKKPRKNSAWQVFVGKELRAGRSVQQAAAAWREKKESA